MNLEYRPLRELVEIRSQGGKLYAEGVAVRYGVASSNEIAPGVVEEIRSGSWTKSLKESDQQAFLEHRLVGDQVLHDGYLGRRSNDTLTFTDSPAELRYAIELPDTAVGRDTAYLLERQDLRGTSVGMMPIRKSVQWKRLDNGMVLRSVGEGKLDHVALTTRPVYGDTEAELVLRSLAETTGHTIDEVREAADAGETGQLLDAPIELPDLSAFTPEQLREALASREQPEETEPDTSTPIHRRPSHWFV